MFLLILLVLFWVLAIFFLVQAFKRKGIRVPRIIQAVISFSLVWLTTFIVFNLDMVSISKNLERINFIVEEIQRQETILQEKSLALQDMNPQEFEEYRAYFELEREIREPSRIFELREEYVELINRMYSRNWIMSPYVLLQGKPEIPELPE